MTSADDATEALLFVREAMGWSLAPARWASIDRSVAALMAALAADDSMALQDAVISLEVLGPVRGPVAEALGPPVRAPDAVRAHLEAAIRVLQQVQAPASLELPLFPVTIFLSDGAIHDQVERAVDVLVQSAGLAIASREPPVVGSWFRRMRAALRSPAGAEVLATTTHMADSRLARRPDAEVTAMLLQNLGPLIGALQPTKDAAIRVGALLIVKVDWTVVVHQLTARQQLVLDHSPGLETDPRQLLHALALPRVEPDPTLT